jgi:electron transfer flavoprotein beta subunit
MGLNLVVLVKQVPDTKNISGEAMKEDGTVNRAALPAVFNPEDLYALEAALSVKDSIPGTKVNVITMGPPQAAQVLKEALYRGADFVALISDRRFAGADTLATSYALKCAVEKLAPYDLVFCGRQAIDGDTAQVGPQTAEKLGINQISCVAVIEGIDAEKRTLVARRSIEGGFERVKASLPLLLTFTDEEYRPRPPSAIRMLGYKNVAAETDRTADDSYLRFDAAARANPLELWNIESIAAEAALCGLSGSPTKVKTIESVVLKSQEIRMVENTDAAVAEMVHELIADHTLG